MIKPSVKFAEASSGPVLVENLRAATTGIEKIDFIRVFFGYFSGGDSLKEKNKQLILFLQECISQNNITLVNRILTDKAVEDLHLSLLKSILIMTSGIPDVEGAYNNLEEVYRKKINIHL
ncbi:hypothetical protein SAMN05660909_00377 [Chitinophaga terrae (ex Kim and Jung 2007)]|uniref:Uncharacterized protein n=1 Tax=Chitinophaga terrae (ex Kim and Jung 2007) TaxID=408074 RepID=A0A1H3XBZ5_9BACT|nr:hypothetical protein [Chitinophaga terrae (ex Kim and Jung 2007)]GEP89807.1 hypothetical protein CTE07_14520 [Chitinophaga terrae (ex Kim and Jung 2007)]SDZ96897.1 hypothetical protein SAMN05660909_00377 [Chitinophaga terrae (ex Kim and Jung 2007)]